MKKYDIFIFRVTDSNTNRRNWPTVLFNQEAKSPEEVIETPQVVASFLTHYGKNLTLDVFEHGTNSLFQFDIEKPRASMPA